ncbi:MAG: SDR family oxidoreductase [Actinomycetota bacterium]|nr:SDR family oxidoreductase [Actinomycetota bacterium]
MDRRLEGKVALVTGASSGIGRATAVRLGREGAAVGVNYRSDEDGAREVVREIEGAGGKAVGIQGDVSREEDARRMVRASVEAFGDLDILVNNAGVQTESPFLEMSLEDWQKVISVDLTGTFLVSREAISHMVETGGGVLVNVSSVHQRVPWPNFAHYATAKGGMKLLTETLALEFAGRGVRVNAVAPGAIETPINAEKFEDPDQRREVEALIPWDRVGQPEEVAACVAFLASDEASYVTGHTLFVDGGMSLYPGFEEGGG